MKHLVTRRKHSKWVRKQRKEINSEKQTKTARSPVAVSSGGEEPSDCCARLTEGCRDDDWLCGVRLAAFLHRFHKSQTPLLHEKSPDGVFQLKEYREACAFLHLGFFFCFKEMSQNIISGSVSAEVDRGIQHRGKNNQTLQVHRNNPPTNLVLQRRTAAASVYVLSTPPPRLW